MKKSTTYGILGVTFGITGIILLIYINWKILIGVWLLLMANYSSQLMTEAIKTENDPVNQFYDDILNSKKMRDSHK